MKQISEPWTSEVKNIRVKVMPRCLHIGNLSGSTVFLGLVNSRLHELRVSIIPRSKADAIPLGSSPVLVEVVV